MFLEIYNLIKKYQNIVIARHIGVDPDAMASQVGLRDAIKKTFPDKPITMYDERFTSVLAHQAMIAGGMKKKDRQNKAVVDKIAACIILEGYLDSLR